MKRLVLALAVCVFAVCGCASQYVMKLSNGGAISTPSKPKLEGSYYRYKDAKGQVYYIPQSRVLEIQPASMAEEELKSKSYSYPEPKRHWWQFWRS